MAERAANYKKMYKLVRTERTSNAADAWNLRRAQLNIDDRDVRDNNMSLADTVALTLTTLNRFNPFHLRMLPLSYFIYNQLYI